jgi:protein phosphatase
VLSRALGTDPQVKPDILENAAFHGDYLLLCSDGLTKMLNDKKILEPFAGAPGPQEIATNLVGMANDAGGRDNVSVIVLHIKCETVWDKLIDSIRKL